MVVHYLHFSFDFFLGNCGRQGHWLCPSDEETKVRKVTSLQVNVKSLSQVWTASNSRLALAQPPSQALFIQHPTQSSQQGSKV